MIRSLSLLFALNLAIPVYGHAARGPSASEAPVVAPGAPATDPATGSIPDEEVAARLRFIEQRLADGQGNAELWWYAWLATHVVSAVGRAVPAALADQITDGDQAARDLRVQMLVGTASSVLTGTLHLVRPWSAMDGAGPLAELPEDTSEQRRAKLAKAEKLLSEVAEQERFGTSWIPQLSAVAQAGAAGLILWLAFDMPTEALINFGVGVAIAQVQFWTQPKQAVTDLEEYQAGQWASSARVPQDPPVKLSLSPMPGGLAFSVRF